MVFLVRETSLNPSSITVIIYEGFFSNKHLESAIYMQGVPEYLIPFEYFEYFKLLLK